MRVSPPRIFPTATHAARPPADAEGSADAFRQCRFLLGEETDTVLDMLNAEGAIAQAAAGSKFRNQVVAATLTAWSRAWLNRLEALHALEWGNVIAALSLLRAATTHQCTMATHLHSDAVAWHVWLEDGLGQDAALHATRLALGEPLPVGQPSALDQLHHILTALDESAFGGAAFLTAMDSDPERIVPTFGDRDFHLGLSELVLGGLLEVGAVSLQLLLAHRERLPIPDETVLETLLMRARKLIDRPDRCRAELLPEQGPGTLLLHNVRRASSGAPKRYLL